MRGAWHKLARICRKWRSIALGSPHRLNLRILCLERIPVRKKLDFWPPFPIVLMVNYYQKWGEDNILATLEHHNRVCQIVIRNISSSRWENALPLMQKPFPILTDLELEFLDERTASIIPDSFLGGSAPRLRNFQLKSIPFLGLPKLLLSVTDLVHLKLDQIPDSEYISADAIATCLSTLTRLKSLGLSFQSPRPIHEWERRHTSSSARTLLPSLTYFKFKGVSEYLEDIVDRIDAPLLDGLTISFFRQPIFDTTRLAQFIGRLPRLKTFNEAMISLGGWHASIRVSSLSEAFLSLEDCPRWPDFQLSPLVQLCTSTFPQALIPMVEELIIVGYNFSSPPGQDGVEPSLWRELLQPFTGVKDLYLYPEITPRIALVLQELQVVGESVMELLPALQNIFIKMLPSSGLVPEGIEQFVASRQLAGHNISVSHWLW